VSVRGLFRLVTVAKAVKGALARSEGLEPPTF
jgi:hypothetical protein